MTCCFRIFCSVLICTVVLSNKQSVRAGYILKIELLSYASIPHTKYNGFCCGTQGALGCIEDCNNRFKFCLRPMGFDQESDACPTGQMLATGPISDDSMEFESGTDLDDGVPNPLIFTAEGWPGSMDFHVRVDHVEEVATGLQGTEVSLVARFLVPIRANPTDNTSVSLESLHKDIRNLGPHIRIGYELRCADNHYGKDCSRSCVGRDDAGGHFVCDVQGFRRCMNGYQNLNTNCTECAPSPECSPVGGYCNSTDDCICRDGYSGDHCSITNPCGESPCQNGATCVPLEDTTTLINFNCICPRGYVGTLCEVMEAVECSTNPCRNGGTCLVLEGGVAGFECICSSGFQGTRCDEKTTFLGPFIGAAIAIALLFLIIAILTVLLLYALWEYKHRKKNKRKPDSRAKFYGTSSLSTLTSSPTANAKTYEDMLDANSASVAEAAEIAAAAGGGGNSDEYARVKSETFDNPIYDQPTLPRRKKHGSMVSVRTGEGDSKLGSVSSMRSLSMGSSQNYSPPSVRAMKASATDDPSCHDYEDIKTNFDEVPKLTLLTSSFRGSTQQMSLSGEVDKLTVINESYDSLPCSGENSLSYFQHSRPHASSVPNCAVADSHRLAIAGRPTITEVTISEAFNKRMKVGSKPNTNYLLECHDDLGANMVEIDMETTEQ